MEVVTAISLAIGIVELVTLATDTIEVFRNLTEKKSPAAHVDQNRKHLQELVSKLPESRARAKEKFVTIPPASDAVTDVAFNSVTTDLGVALDRLTSVIHKYGPQKSESTFMLSIAAIRYQWSGKKKVDELHQQLKDIEQTFQTSILAELRADVKSFSVEAFAALDEQTREFARLLAKDCTDLKQLIQAGNKEIQDLVVKESQLTRDRLDSGLRETNDNINALRVNHAQDAKDDELQKLLKSLTYEQQNARYNAITRSYENTFDWIYEPNSQASKTRSASKNTAAGSKKILEWLQSSETMFWISGKPGSGKSTLMKFLVDQPRTLQLLKERDASSLIISVFIWNAGSAQERKLNYIVASLLRQLLRKRHDIAQKLLEKDENLRSKEFIGDWPYDYLVTTIYKALQETVSNVCIFMDGLDESETSNGDGFSEMLRLIRKLGTLPNVKLIVASRPEVLLQNELQACPHVRLQDLTYEDLYIFTTADLTDSYKTMTRRDKEEDEIEALVKLILDKAQGIFLWVRLVLSSIRSGLNECDTRDELYDRVENLPEELNAMYKSMWGRSNRFSPNHPAKGALYFKLLLQKWTTSQMKSRWQSYSLHLLLLASDESLLRQHLEGGTFVQSDVWREKCVEFEKRVLARCAGLVEVLEPEPSYIDKRLSRDDDVPIISKAEVRFIHKSAADFLLTTDGQLILQQDNTSVAELCSRVILSGLVGLLITSQFPLLNQYLAYLAKGHAEKVFATNSRPSSAWGIPFDQLSDLYAMTLNRIFQLREWKFDFICLASEAGQYAYVKRHMQQMLPPGSLRFLQQKPAQPKSRVSFHKSASSTETKSIILGHACKQFSGTLNDDRVEFILWLLSEGADPNLSIRSWDLCGTTPFHSFLLQAMFWGFCYVDALKPKREDQIQAHKQMHILDAFIAHGADPKTPLLFYVNQTGFNLMFKFGRFKNHLISWTNGTNRTNRSANDQPLAGHGEDMDVIIEMRNAELCIRSLLNMFMDKTIDILERRRNHQRPFVQTEFGPQLRAVLLIDTRLVCSKEILTKDESDQVLSHIGQFDMCLQLRHVFQNIDTLEMDVTESGAWLNRRINFDQVLSTAHIPFQSSFDTTPGWDSTTRNPEPYNKLREVLDQLPRENVQSFLDRYQIRLFP